jgi:hypothetical protein
MLHKMITRDFPLTRYGTTKYSIQYIKSTTVYEMSPRRNWGSPTPSFASECFPPPGSKGGGGGHSPAGKGLGESQFRRLEKSLALCLLCVRYYWGSIEQCSARTCGRGSTVYHRVSTDNHKPLSRFVSSMILPPQRVLNDL